MAFPVVIITKRSCVDQAGLKFIGYVSYLSESDFILDTTFIMCPFFVGQGPPQYFQHVTIFEILKEILIKLTIKKKTQPTKNFV